MEKHKRVWAHSFANKLGHLFQGIRDIKGTNTCTFIRKSQVPSSIHPTYRKIVCSIQNHKDKRERTRLTVGGNQIKYTGTKATPTADLIISKLLFNSTISTPGARYYTIDLANFYLNTPLPNPEYMRLQLNIIPKEIIVKYNLQELEDKNEWEYIQINKGMYGLPQAGIRAYNLLTKRLSEKGYYQSQNTPGLWKHVHRDIAFCLVVDNFGIKTTKMEHMLHL